MKNFSNRQEVQTLTDPFEVIKRYFPKFKFVSDEADHSDLDPSSYIPERISLFPTLGVPLKYEPKGGGIGSERLDLDKNISLIYSRSRRKLIGITVSNVMHLKIKWSLGVGSSQTSIELTEYGKAGLRASWRGEVMYIYAKSMYISIAWSGQEIAAIQLHLTGPDV